MIEEIARVVALEGDIALLETDRQLLTNGVTTAYHGVTLSWEPGLRGAEAFRAMLAAMERRELIERRLDRGDARRTEVAIASAGREVVARIGPRSESVYGEIETALGTEDLASLHELLDRLATLAD